MRSRSTDLVMNNLFRAENTFCETQQSSVGALTGEYWITSLEREREAMALWVRSPLSRTFALKKTGKGKKKKSLSCERVSTSGEAQTQIRSRLNQTVNSFIIFNKDTFKKKASRHVTLLQICLNIWAFASVCFSCKSFWGGDKLTRIKNHSVLSLFWNYPISEQVKWKK